MTRYKLIFVLICISLYTAFPFGIKAEEAIRPNILVLFLDDLDPDFGCYGNTLVTTPNIDKLASEGVRFTKAYAAGTVCSPSHTSLFTGCYTTTIGCPHHRSNYIEKLPEGYTILTELIKREGYFNVNFKSNGDRMFNKIYGATAKTDLNFDRGKPENNLESGKEVFEHLQIIDPMNIATYFNGGVWDKQKEGQPFFAYANIETGKRHGFEPGRIWAREKGIEVDSTMVEIPPHYSDTPEVRHILASALDAVSHIDEEVGKFLTALENAGLSENTMVILVSDHGATLPRHKQNLWNTGIHVPLIIRWPHKVEAGTVNHELASIIDIAPTLLNGIHAKVPKTMEGLNLLGNSLKKRKYIFATRDGLDGYFDCSRAVVSREFHYIQHYYPEIPFTGNAYARRVLSFPSMLKLYKSGMLNDLQAIYYDTVKTPVELYAASDKHQAKNLAANPDYETVQNKFRNTLSKWQKKTGDTHLNAREILNVKKVPVGTKVDDILDRKNDD